MKRASLLTAVLALLASVNTMAAPSYDCVARLGYEKKDYTYSEATASIDFSSEDFLSLEGQPGSVVKKIDLNSWKLSPKSTSMPVYSDGVEVAFGVPTSGDKDRNVYLVVAMAFPGKKASEIQILRSGNSADENASTIEARLYYDVGSKAEYQELGGYRGLGANRSTLRVICSKK